MPIVFSAVASNRNIVSNFASCDGNFTEIAEQVLSKLPPCNKKMTYSHGTYLLHYIAEDGLLYFCITDKLCQRSRAFLFLNEIQRRFMRSKQTTDFTTTLAAEMYRYSEDYNTVEIRKGDLDELNNIGVGCSESLLGEKILYVNNPDVISYSTISYMNSSPGRVSMSGVCPSAEESVVKPTTKAIAVISQILPEMSPIFYIVIIGMIILVIAMSVYALGPASCVVVTGIGIYSLLRSYMGTKDKLD